MSYLIKTVVDYPDNLGNPEVERYLFRTKEEGVKAYKKAVKGKYTAHGVNFGELHGKNVRVELYKTDDEIEDDGELLESHEIKSELLPKGAVVVTFQHVRYLDYCYEVTDVRYANDGERYEDLHPDKRCTGSPVDRVYSSFGELEKCYNFGYGILGKLQKGSNIIEAFLEEPYDTDED